MAINRKLIAGLLAVSLFCFVGAQMANARTSKKIESVRNAESVKQAKSEKKAKGGRKSESSKKPESNKKSNPSKKPEYKWIETLPEAKPYTRWWWLGSAVDEAGLEYNLNEYAKAGIGGVEITPIYGVKGNDANNIPYLSAQWMQMLAKTEDLGCKLGIEVDMATGTGWPFGGPNVPKDEAASKLVVADGQFSVGRTGQKVKRAAPGGEGFVIDHFDRQSVMHYLSTFDKAFGESKTSFPHTFFNDSYEVYGADWTPNMLEEFKNRRGYSLEDHKDDFLGTSESSEDIKRRVMSDYRETLSDLLYENFTTVWTDWAHSHGSITRCQAHGSPANLIDLYAEVDIPECEGFGLSDFHIKGLRTDPGFTKRNDSDLSMMKYASSGAHISGKRFTSSETFTWLTEHFRTSFSQCKPDFDLFMIAGVNHVFFHGSCYTPENDAWPGWKFYASVDMSPTNSLWRDAPAFFKYIERVQSFMQMGEPDNDVLVYLPFYDMIYEQPGRLVQFDIHSMAKRAPKFIQSINAVINAGYDCDYISDRYLLKSDAKNVGNHKIITTTGTNQYEAVLVPDVRFMPLATLRKLLNLAQQGVRVVFINALPQSAPGLKGLERQKEFDDLAAELKKVCLVVSDYSALGKFITPEYMRINQGLSCIRRSNGADHIYFISNLQERDVNEWISLGKNARFVTIYNPMNGEVHKAMVDNSGDHTKVRLQLLSGQSTILVATDTDNSSLTPYLYIEEELASDELKGWKLQFVESAPVKITKTYKFDSPCSWTELGDQLLNETMASGVYSTSFSMKKLDDGCRIILDLGDVRETARVRVNGQNVATLFAVPYRLDITDYVTRGKNKLEGEVTNLGANRISKLDRDGVQWRKFNEINVVDINYKTTSYADWAPVPSGLCRPVKIIKAKVSR